MIVKLSSNKDLYFTKDHEWIDFQGAVAYTGVCSFKLIGFKEIHEIVFHEPLGFKKQGEVISIIKYNDYQIVAHMPVDGKVVQFNNDVLNEKPNVLIQHAENRGWIALIIPSQPLERKDLLIAKQYHLHYKR
jgi:glycine cleavage system H protein